MGCVPSLKLWQVAWPTVDGVDAMNQPAVGAGNQDHWVIPTSRQDAVDGPVVTSAAAVEAFGARRFAQNLADARQKVAGYVVVGAGQERIAQGRIGRLILGDAAVVGITTPAGLAHLLPPVACANIVLAPGVHVIVTGEQDLRFAHQAVALKDLADGGQAAGGVPVFGVGVDQVKGPALDLDGGGHDRYAAAAALDAIAVDAVGDGQATRFHSLDPTGIGVDGDALELVAPVADDGIIAADQPPDLGHLVVTRADTAGYCKAPFLAQPRGQDFLDGNEVGAQGLDVAGQAFLDVAAAELDDVGPTPGRGVTYVD